MWRWLQFSLIPICSVRYPASVDYLNHLGGLFVLTVPSGHPVHAFYKPDWHLVPNLGVDIIVLGLNKLMPLEPAMKVAWVLIFVSLPSAFWFLYHALHRRIAPVLLVSALCLFNFPLTAGFLSFSLGLAAALATVGLWFRLGEKVTLRNLLILNAVSAAIVVVHVAAMAALGLTIVALYALRPPWRPAALIGRAIVAGCGFLAPLFLLMQMGDGSGPRFPHHFVFSILGKPFLLWQSAFSAIPVADGIGAAALIASLYIIVRLAGVRADRRLIPTLIVWAVVLIVLPAEIDRAVTIDRRLVLFPTLLFLASLHAPPTRLQWIGSAVAAAAVCARVAFILPAWQAYNFAIADFRSLGTAVEPGAKILTATAPEGSGNCNETFQWPPFYHHAAVLLFMERYAFIPGLFSAPGMQPIPSYGKISSNFRSWRARF